MDRIRRPSFYTLSLLLGSLLVAIAGLVHPTLAGDGAAQLETIAATSAWRTIHWSLLFGFVLVVTGLMGVVERHVASAGSTPARAAAFLSVLGYGALMVNVLFMIGAGWTLAQTYTLAEQGLTTTRAVFLYDMVHPFGLAAMRIGAFTIGVATYALGWAVRNGGVYPKWLGYAGIGAGLVGMAAALVFSESSPNVLAGVVLATVWQLATAVGMFLERPAA